MTTEQLTEFGRELKTLVNRHYEAKTPDGILARYVAGCMDAFTEAVIARDEIFAAAGTQPAHAARPEPSQRLVIEIRGDNPLFAAEMLNKAVHHIDGLRPGGGIVLHSEVEQSNA